MNSPLPDSPSSVSLGVIFFAVHLGLTLLLQIENYLFFVRPLAQSSIPSFAFFLRLPFLQLENLLVSMILGFTLVLFSWNWVLRGFSFGLSFFCNFFVIANQISFRLTGNHLRSSLTESVNIRWDLVFDSFALGVNGLFLANAALLLIISIVLAVLFIRAAHAPPKNRGTAHISWGKCLTFVVLFVSYCGISAAVTAKTTNAFLERHPLLVFLADLWHGSKPRLQASKPVPDYEKPRYGTFEEKPAEIEALAGVSASFGDHQKPLHIFLIALESVGTHQIIKDGIFDQTMVPNIFRLAQNGLLFDTIYTTFPGTSRAHISLVTGGSTITEKSVFKELVQPWSGPTLISELKKANYSTGFFATADLDFENLDVLYQRLGFGMFFHFGLATEAFRKEHKLNSWGGSEGAVFPLAMNWVKKVSQGPKPVFMEFLTNATHHPYSTPASFIKPFEGDADLIAYKNSVAYVDSFVGQLIDETVKAGLYENSLFIVFGDHGEAFGQRHQGNFLHKDHLFEENVRTFFLFAAPGKLKTPVISHRIGSIGDLLPTLLPLLKLPLPEMAGRNLLAQPTHPRIVFFHKLASPPKWGLRDGDWKYIAQVESHKDQELFNLRDDPLEKFNLAAQNATQTKLYQQLCSTWYTQADLNYIAGISLASPTSGINAHGFSATQASYSLHIGALNEKGEFVEMPRMNTNQKVFAIMQQKVPDSKKIFKADWVSPKREHHSSSFSFEPDRPEFMFAYREKRPLLEGQWELLVWDGPTLLVSQTFAIDPQTPQFPRVQ